jgi:hypothetical protein
MEYADVVRDFAQRTEHNLELIESVSAEPGGRAFEFTQLVNSMLGLLVFPRERYYDRIPQTSLDVLAREGWPVPRVAGDLPPAKDLRELMRYMRNAVAHFNIEFVSTKDRELVGLRLWNQRGPRKTWEAQFTKEQLREITRRFIEVLMNDRPVDDRIG